MAWVGCNLKDNLVLMPRSIFFFLPKTTLSFVGLQSKEFSFDVDFTL